MNEIHIENWTVQPRPGWMADSGKDCLVGECYHPRLECSGQVITSAIVWWNGGDVVVTKSGSTYRLGSPAS